MAYKFFILFVASAVQAAIIPVSQVAPAAAVVPLAPAAPVLGKIEEDFDATPQYSFAYDVQDAFTGDSKAQYETRNGDVVQGSYSFIEADGTRRIVDYTADPINGFNAVVSREPVVAVAGVPVVPVAPVAPLGLAPVASALPVAPVQPAAFPGPAPEPVVPASGPDSDVEVIDARSGPLRQEPSRNQPASQPEPFARINRRPASVSAPAQSSAELRQNSAPLRAIANRLPQTDAAEAEQQRSTNIRVNSNNFQEEKRQQLAQQRAAAPQAPITFPAYAAYTGAYSSPLAFTAPVAGLTYTALNL